jgi:DNA-binding transcriptional LysR family regulator
MEMREIEAFLAVADEFHFGRAARRLHVSTSHISQTIRALERRVGAPLFERTSRRVTLTPLGAQLLADFRPAHQRLVQGLAEARRAAARQRGHETLSVGFTSTLAPAFATRLVESFERDHAGCRVARSELAAHTIMKRIESSEFGVDVVVMWMPESFRRHPGERLRAGPAIGTGPRGALMSRRHPLASRTRIDIEELTDFDLHHPGTTTEFDDGWTPPRTPAGKPLRRVLSRIAASPADMRELLGEDVVHLTIVQLPEAWSDPELVIVPLTGLPPVVCAPLWSAADRNPRIAEFVKAATLLEPSRNREARGTEPHLA